MAVRLLIVAAVVVLCLAGRWAYTRRQARLAGDDRPVPRIPDDLLSDRPTTWVVFSTPYCASCGPVADMLRHAEAASGVVMVDATKHPDLADAFRVRRSPTVLRADRAGTVDLRLVGPEAVRDHLSHLTSAGARPQPASA
jgi:hypothetical protein